MVTFVIAIDNPGSADVRALLDKHLAFAKRESPPEDVHALEIEELLAENVSFFAIRENGALVGVGALKQLDESQVEVKSMHTAQAARRRGVGRAMVDHLIGIARARGYRRVSIETGSTAVFAPARALYASAGFEPCGPFGEYQPSPNSAYMTLELDHGREPPTRTKS